MDTKAKPPKKRLDVLLVERGLVESRQKAQAAILAGEVRVNRQRVDKAGTRVAEDAEIEFTRDRPRFASRAGEKLEGALVDFGIAVEDRVCLDVGASTGGFTDCLLQRGARRVYAVDVSTEQLAWRLRQDPRVVPVERNARYLAQEDLGVPVDLVTVDLAFISVAKVLPALVSLARPEGEFVILVKPQFELERGDVEAGGLVRDPRLHRLAVERVQAVARELGLEVIASAESRLSGAEGNREFFLYARRR